MADDSYIKWSFIQLWTFEQHGEGAWPPSSWNHCLSLSCTLPKIYQGFSRTSKGCVVTNQSSQSPCFNPCPWRIINPITLKWLIPNHAITLRVWRCFLYILFCSEDTQEIYFMMLTYPNTIKTCLIAEPKIVQKWLILFQHSQKPLPRHNADCRALIRQPMVKFCFGWFYIQLSSLFLWQTDFLC